MNQTWRPNSQISALKDRARILSEIRAFFNVRNVYEVETPCLSAFSVTDPFMETLTCDNAKASKQAPMFLQTSPEYAMKRLLAAGSGDIYQIAKAFRNDELSKHHNPEFTMLEWYRVGYTMHQLIDEVIDLLAYLQADLTCQKTTYQSLFIEHLHFDPLDIAPEHLFEECKIYRLSDYCDSLRAQYQNEHSLLRDALLQVLFNQVIEPKIGQQHPIVVYHFPASQASLASLHDDKTANRFELYYKGLELANGFEELTDAANQRERFEQDNIHRKHMGLPEVTLDHRFLDALESGLPRCSGVALGIDRLIMILLKASSIDEVISFNFSNA